MGPKHDTRSALEAIDGTVVCQSHQRAIEGIYEKIDEVASAKMSRGQTMWAIGILMAVALAYGGMLWSTTSGACAENAQKNNEIDRRVLTLEIQWKAIQTQLDRIETEQRAIRVEAGQMRAETCTQLEGIRRLVQEKKVP